MRIEPAAEAQHGGFIAAAQKETVRVSYGRDFTGDECQVLRRRLNEAFGNPLSRVSIALNADGAPIGYYWIEVQGERVAFLLDIYVIPAMRRNNVGVRLWEDLVAKSRELGLCEIRLAVAEANSVARAFFARAGLTPIDEEIREGQRWLELRSFLTPP